MIGPRGLFTLDEQRRQAALRAARQLIELDEKGITTYIVNRDIPEGLDEAYADLAYTLTRPFRHEAVVVDHAVLERIKPS